MQLPLVVSRPHSAEADGLTDAEALLEPYPEFMEQHGL
jgi:hypothetical protein